MPEHVRVLVIDGSIVGRHLVGRALAGETWIDVAGITTPGPAALKRLDHLVPDVVLLDVGQAPGEGLDLLRAILTRRPRLPVIMLTTADRASAALLLEVLAVGGSDLCTVPTASGDLDAGIEMLRAQLVPKLRAMLDAGEFSGRRSARPPATTNGGPGGAPSGSPDPTPGARAAEESPPRRTANPPGRRSRPDVIVVGASTGGPNALKVLWSMLPRDLPVPVLVVQHMPATFTPLLAQQLDALGTLPCRETLAGARLAAGIGQVAPGDRHLVVHRGGDGAQVQLEDSAKLHGCRPAVDRLFTTAAEAFGPGVLAVVLTGMGVDGLDGCRAVAAAGGEIVVQDALTSVVWGMPGSVAGAGLADAVLALGHIGPAIVDRVVQGRAVRGASFDAARDRPAGPLPSEVIS